MANAQKYTAAASGHLAAHYERRQVPAINEAGEITMEYIKFGNQDIDPSRTHLNYNLAPERPNGQVAFINERISEVRALKRADVNVMVSWVVTVPKVFWHEKNPDANPEEITGEEKIAVEKLFCQRVYNFLCERYGGEKNVISSYVHMDEKSTHIHHAIVPVVPDHKRGGEKLSAKEMITKRDLQSFHTDLERYLDSFHDWHFEVVNEATVNGNRTVAEMKKQAAHEEVYYAENEAFMARLTVEDLQKDIKSMKAEKTALAGEIKALDDKKKEAKEEFERELPALGAQISDAKNELKAKKAELEQKKQELELTQQAVEDYMSRGRSLQINMERAREEVADKKLLEKVKAFFKAFPQVKELFDKWKPDRPSKGRMLSKHNQPDWGE